MTQVAYGFLAGMVGALTYALLDKWHKRRRLPEKSVEE